METRRVVVVLALALLAITSPALGAQAPTTTQTNDTAGTETASNDTETTNTSMGAEISGFMQASAAETNDSVSDELWQETYEDTDSSERTAALSNHSTELERRLQQLENQSQILTARYENGTLSGTAYRAQASSIAGRIAALERAINDTADRATSNGVDTTKLDRLQMQASNLSRKSVATVAGNLSTVGPPANANAPDGPPGQSDNATNRSHDRNDLYNGQQTQVGNGTDSIGPPEKKAVSLSNLVGFAGNATRASETGTSQNDIGEQTGNAEIVTESVENTANTANESNDRSANATNSSTTDSSRQSATESNSQTTTESNRQTTTESDTSSAIDPNSKSTAESNRPTTDSSRQSATESNSQTTTDSNGRQHSGESASTVSASDSNGQSNGNGTVVTPTDRTRNATESSSRSTDGVKSPTNG